MCAEVQQRLQQFSREVLDLLKNQGSHCRLPVSKFVSAYHQYFSRQCRVADYGFSKIIDLLSAIPKSIQVTKKNNIHLFIKNIYIYRYLAMEINVL
jgi:meiosis arrest female protein 1